MEKEPKQGQIERRTHERRTHDRRMPQLTPESTKAWTLALYPAIVILVVGFMIGTNRPITTELAGLLVGLLTAGGFQAVIKKTGAPIAESNDSDDSSDNIRSSRHKELENDDRRRPNDSDRGRHYSRRVWRSQIRFLYPTARGLRLLYG